MHSSIWTPTHVHTLREFVQRERLTTDKADEAPLTITELTRRAMVEPLMPAALGPRSMCAVLKKINRIYTN